MKLNLNDIDKNTKNIVIGVSAGPDSMALLHYMLNNTNYNIICAHVNHNVREESIVEQNYLEQYCKDNNIVFECFTISEYKENNFEGEARKIRYNFYSNILKRYNTKYLLLAHHADDLIETILMKIARGSNLEGYAGIKKINKYNDMLIVRPLLDYTKDEILNYNEENNITYFIDKSNEDTKYTRNRYRKYILPFFKNEDANIHKKFIMYSNTLLEYDEYIKKETIKLVNKLYANNILNINKFRDIEYFMQKNILYYILNNLYNNDSNIIKGKHIDNIIKICNSNNNNLQLNLPNNIIVLKEYNNLRFDNKPIYDEYKYLLEDTIVIDKHIVKKIVSSNENGNNICRLNSNKVDMPLFIRNKKDGDKIEVMGLKGHKLLSDIFIENKIPYSLRKSYPILVDANDNILWVPNLKKSKFNTKNNEFCDIILEYCEKEEKYERK